MKYSIITVNYNNKDGLRKTIESVIHQTFRDFEFIVIDGGSTDGSAEVLKEYDAQIDYWVSEPDGGIYQGMNKGIRNWRKSPAISRELTSSLARTIISIQRQDWATPLFSLPVLRWFTSLWQPLTIKVRLSDGNCSTIRPTMKTIAWYLTGYSLLRRLSVTANRYSLFLTSCAVEKKVVSPNNR